MKVPFERKKLEALERMKMLNLFENAIRDFQQDNKVNMSECGFLYWLDDEQTKMVSEFETEHDTLVYHAIHNYTEFGELLTFFYVSDHEDEWEYDRADLKDGYACAYVKNLDEDAFSEFGSVAFKEQFGGLVRTA